MSTALQRIQIRRGLKANLPTTALNGELLLATDTKELFKGTGTSVEPIKSDPLNIIGLLDGNGKINASFLPPISITSVYVVADITARDALTAQPGDVAVVLDDGDGERASYIYDGSDWVKLSDSSESVDSVNGFSGTVVLTTTDIAEGTNLYYTDARVASYLSTNNYLNNGDDIKRLGAGSDPDGTLYGAQGGLIVAIDTIDAGIF